MNQDSLIDTLREIRFLNNIGPMHLEQIAKISRIKDLKHGEIVFRQGDPAQFVYLVVSGSVSLEICAAGAGCKQILTLASGELLSSAIGAAFSATDGSIENLLPQVGDWFRMFARHGFFTALSRD